MVPAVENRNISEPELVFEAFGYDIGDDNFCFMFTVITGHDTDGLARSNLTP